MRARIVIDVPDAFLAARAADINRSYADYGNPIEPPLDPAAYALDRLREVAADELGVALYGWPLDVTVEENEAEQKLAAHLAAKAASWEDTGGALAYRGPCDFVLRHGQWFTPQPFPLASYPQGAHQACYANAIAMAAGFGHGYYEGYAMMAGGDVAQHAWNVDSGRLLDCTWLNTGHAYLGVQFAAARADDATWNGDATVLDDCNRGWPLLQQPWDGEPGFAPDAAGRARMDRLAVAIAVAAARATARRVAEAACP